MAQIELMAIDLPLVVHDRKEDSEKVPSKERMNRLAEKWNQERAGRKNLVCKEINLSDFLSNNKKENNDGE